MTEVSASSENTVPVVNEAAAPQAVPITSSPRASSPASVEWDHTGRVISSKFSCGHVSKFRYDQNGNLYAFSYAKLAWSTIDGVNWTARDQAMDWTMSGRVDVAMDGSLKIERATVTRILKLNGLIIDEFGDGTAIETMRQTPETSPADLLATGEERAIVREPRVLMKPSTSVPKDAQAGAPIEGKTADHEPADASRRVVAGGRRMNRLRTAEVKLTQQQERPQEGRTVEARSVVEDFVATSAVRFWEMTKGPEAAELPPFLDRLAAAALRQRRVDEARLLHERSLAIRTKNLGADHSETGINYHGLGRIYLEWGRYTEAEQYLLNAVQVFDKGLKKAKFLLETDTVQAPFVQSALTSLINSLHSLSSLYHEQRKMHLCLQLHESAAKATNSVDRELRVGIDAALQSLAAMAAQAEIQNRR